MSKTQTASGAAPWPKVRLGDVCEIIGGGTPSIHEKAYYDGGIPWATVRDMGCRVIKKTERTISRLGLENSATNIIKGGELIISTHVGLGKVCYLAQDTAINQDLKGVIPTTKELSRDYLYWWFVSIADYLVSKGTGATVKGVKLDFVKQLQLLLPPLAEQKKIVEKVEKALKRVDALKAQFERMEKSAADYFKAALAETFAAVKGEKMKLGDVCETITDGDHQPPPKTDDGVPFLVISNVADGVLDFKATRHVPVRYYEAIDEKRKPKMGDVLLTVTGSFGIPVLVDTDRPFCFQRHIALLRTSKMTPEFLKYLMLAPESVQYFDRVATGAAQRTVSLSSLREMKVTLPQMQSQREVVKRLTEIKCTASRLEEAARRCIGICGKMRKAILAEAFQ